MTLRRKNRSSRNSARLRWRAQVHVGGGQDAHVDPAGLAGAEPLELAALQHAQELDLAGRREVADLVEEQRAAVGRLEAADAALDRAGEGARLGAEELALQQLVGQRARVHLHERLVAARELAWTISAIFSLPDPVRAR